jgi:hypothetical protein
MAAFFTTALMLNWAAMPTQSLRADDRPDKPAETEMQSPPAESPAAEKDKSENTDKESKEAKEAAKPKPELNPRQTALRDALRRTLAAHARAPFNSGDNTATEIMSRALAFGCDGEVGLESARGQRINAITCLCWNYPCAGFEMMAADGKHIAPRVGYGYQERPGEFLAMLALSRVPQDYPVRVGKRTATVADVVEAEKLACRGNADMSLVLLALAYYVDQPEWKNALGETWSIERIVAEETERPVLTAHDGGLNRLLGLSYAIAKQQKRTPRLSPVFERAKKYAVDFQDYALRLQNEDGSWGPGMLAAKGASNDAAVQLRATGRVLEWLAIAMPDEKLQDQRVVAAVEYLIRLLGSQRYQYNSPALPTAEIVSLGHALHALVVYDQRVFQPFDPAEPPPAEQPQAAAAASAKTPKMR